MPPMVMPATAAMPITVLFIRSSLLELFRGFPDRSKT
jgi:hypothetical protein